jgi:ketosteroid isomerase-like protein
LIQEVSVTQRQTFSDFMQQREAAARAYVRGDAGPLRELAARERTATFFGPRGGKVAGADEVWAKYEADVSLFQPGGETHFEVLQQVEGTDVAYWVGFQHATVRLAGNAQPVAMSLRVTELFRREGDSWKLVHRHADSLADAG